MTILNAWRTFEDFCGGDGPVRTIDELRDKIHETNLRYDDLNPETETGQKFWDDLFTSGWALGAENE
jgi:hypothetical protein